MGVKGPNRTGRHEEGRLCWRPGPDHRLCVEDIVPIGTAVHGEKAWEHDTTAQCTLVSVTDLRS